MLGSYGGTLADLWATSFGGLCLVLPENGFASARRPLMYHRKRLRRETTVWHCIHLPPAFSQPTRSRRVYQRPTKTTCHDRTPLNTILWQSEQEHQRIVTPNHVIAAYLAPANVVLFKIRVSLESPIQPKHPSHHTLQVALRSSSFISHPHA